MLWALSAAAQAPAWPHEHSDIAPSPRVTWGKLENGLRYAILPNTTPAKLVSLRLLVLTGSLHERDDERGYAHFVEHMAFNGTRGFAPGELIKFLQREGVAFGPHVNAETSETRTLYKLDLPEATAASLADGLRVLRDFADGILFNKAEVERERGVLMSEMQARRSVASVRMDARRQFLFPKTLFAERNPLGTETAIKRASPAALRTFYDAGYRPERMVIVVAGDCDRDDVESSVQQRFSSLGPRGAPRPEPEMGGVPREKGIRATLHSALSDGVQIDLMAARTLDERDCEAVRRRYMHLELARSMVSRRLQRLAETRPEVIAGSQLRSDFVANRFAVETASVAGNVREWSTLLGFVEQAVRRATEQGFDATELATAKDYLRATLRDEAAQAETAVSPMLADALAANIESGMIFVFPGERLAARLAELDAATVEDCRAAWREEWERGVPRIFVSASPKLLDVPAAKILAAYEASRATPVTAATALVDAKWAYEDFGPAGAIAHREHVSDLDVWQVRYANGVRLNLKRTALERGRVCFELRFGSGRLTEPPESPGLGLWTVGLLLGGLKKHTTEELQQAMRGHDLSLNATADSESCTVRSNAAAIELTRLLELTAAILTDPAWRPEGETRTRRVLGDLHGRLRSAPEAAMQCFVDAFRAGGDMRVALPERAILERYNFATLEKWLQPMLAGASLEATLVGDFDIDAAIAEVARTLGALPSRVEGQPDPKLFRLRFPQPPETRRYLYASVAGRPTTVLLDWPVHDALTVAESRRLRLLAAVLEDRLRVRIREEAGATYTPEASFLRNETYPGLASLRCRFDVAAKSLAKIGDQAVGIASDLAKNGVTEEELARARAQAVAGARQQLSRNEYWLDALHDSQTRLGRLDEVRSLESDYATATKSELDELAARYLAPGNLFRFIIEPKTTK